MCSFHLLILKYNRESQKVNQVLLAKLDFGSVDVVPPRTVLAIVVLLGAMDPSAGFAAAPGAAGFKGDLVEVDDELLSHFEVPFPLVVLKYN